MNEMKFKDLDKHIFLSIYKPKINKEISYSIFENAEKDIV
jgi:hypothetical protein